MSRRQADHYAKISKRTAKRIRLVARLRTLQRAWEAQDPVFKRELLSLQRDAPTKGTVAALIERQEGRCFYCCIKLHKDDYHIDHIIPRSKGGLNTLSNYALACIPCNIRKKDKSVMDFMIRMLTGHYKKSPSRR